MELVYRSSGLYGDFIVRRAAGRCSMRNTKETDGQTDATAKVAARPEKVHSAQEKLVLGIRYAAREKQIGLNRRNNGLVPIEYRSSTRAATTLRANGINEGRLPRLTKTKGEKP